MSSTFTQKSSYSYEDLIACGHGKLFGPGNARLPLPPMLMFDRILRISETGGANDKGEIVAELDVNPDLWFFNCHFEDDPVMPGCLGLDAMWQMVGFFLGWMGLPGRGRAISTGSIKLKGQVLPSVKKVTWNMDIRRVINRRLILGVADGKMFADGEIVYEAEDLRVGLFMAENAT